MAISPVSKPSTPSLQRIMAEIGRSMDARSEAGSRISDGEAQQILGRLQGLPAPERTQAEHALRDLLVNDFFSVTPQARQKFAEAFGIQARDLEPKERAELVGLASARTAFQAGVQAIAKTPQMDRKTMKRIVDGAETYLDRPAQAYLAAVLRNANKDGTLKIDADARKDFTRWVGKLETDASVSNWSQSFEARGSGQVDYLSALMASGMCFEDLVAAFMMHMAGKIQDETKEKMEEVRRAEAGQGPARSAGPGPKGEGSRVDELFRKRGLDRPAQGHEPLTPPATGRDAPAVAQAAAPGRPQPATEPNAAASAAGPAAAGPAAAGQAAGVDPAYARRTQQQLEAAVQSVHAHLHDANTPGVIDAREAAKVAEKFARLEGPVAPLVARAMVNTLRSTPGVYLESDTFRPLVAWMKKTLGDDIDLSPLPRRNPGDATDPIAKQLRASDKLEDKLAGFVVDTLLASDVALKDKMKDLKRLTHEMFDDPKAGPALEEVIARAPGSAPALQAQVAGDAAAPASGAAAAAEAGPAASAAKARGARSPDPWQTPRLSQPEALFPAAAAGDKAAGARRSPQMPDPWAGAAQAPTGADRTATRSGATASQQSRPGGVASGMAGAGTDRQTITGQATAGLHGAQETRGPAEAQKSRQMLWEELKNLQNELAQVMQAMSNMLNSMHQNAMNSVRSIR